MRGEIAGFLVRAGALVALWIGIVAVGTDSAEYRPWLLAACALYFALYFLVPLFSRGRWLLIGSALTAAAAQRWFVSGESVTPFLLYYLLLLEGLLAADDRDKIPTAAGVALASLLPYAGKAQTLPLTFPVYFTFSIPFSDTAAGRKPSSGCWRSGCCATTPPWCGRRAAACSAQHPGHRSGQFLEGAQ
ncbi:MAG: hypothetical protein O7C59_06425, partial [Rickettsia endosymbiont of Ixodes persulcatus]|nr:hypothetical protein [Rickettsia endosymbiont of Ixodes persulcatus]